MKNFNFLAACLCVCGIVSVQSRSAAADAHVSDGQNVPCRGGAVPKVWNPDRGDHYVNPVLNADWSDPDVCRVGNDYYMTASSFNCMPGLPILHSTDLVNWEIVGAALTDYPVPGWKDRVQHGNGVWAPAIRYHDGRFYIYCGDPDRGIFMVSAEDPRGRWSEPVWVVKAKGYIDPCPLWDEDGNAWLSHGCAGSRALFKSVLFMAPMSEDGTRLLADSRIVYDGHQTQPTIEGTKLYFRNGWYYIFSPAGCVPTGWQVVLRSRSPYGPYEERVVMAQGKSPVNGPHQGAWVDTPGGEDWFLHFQDKGAYGRVVHLQPMRWADDWPVIGTDDDGDGVGEPVMRYRKPDLPSSGVFQPADSDEFNEYGIGLQWQWQGTPSPYWSYTDAANGALRLYSVPAADGYRNLSDSPNLLLQKFPADDFTVTAKMTFVPNPQLEGRGESAGLVVMGLDYSALVLKDTGDGVLLYNAVCRDALEGKPESVSQAEEGPHAGEASVLLESRALPVPYSDRYMSTTVPPVPPLAYRATDVWLRVKVESVPHEGDVDDAVCTFYYSTDGKRFHRLGNRFVARPGKWIGAKVGLFCNRPVTKNDAGWLDVDWFRVTR